MQQFNIADLLPPPPWIGPPLPRFLGIVWPWMQEEWQLPSLALPEPRHYITSVEEDELALPHASLATYSNEETWEISWSKDGLPTKIAVHRNAVRNG